MSSQDNRCKACDGDGMLADDEGWQYNCSVCHGTGIVTAKEKSAVRILEVDDNNRLLD